MRATAVANPNIAFIKYWGNRDDRLRLAANSSLSMNLAGLETRTTVEFSLQTAVSSLQTAEGRRLQSSLQATDAAPGMARDEITVGGRRLEGEEAERVTEVLDRVREMASSPRWDSSSTAVPTLAVSGRWSAVVESTSNFPQGAGIASSAAGFAALAVAAAAAAGLSLTEAELSRLARRGSGSACRSVPGGFVEWEATGRDETSFARSIAPPEHWALTDLVAVVSREPKAVGSTGGHALAATSPLQGARIAGAPGRLAECKAALLERDFERFAAVVEQDSDLMHAVMMTSVPALQYRLPEALAMMRAIRRWRAEGLAVCYTVDAGPNVHVICAPGAAGEARRELEKLDGVMEILEAGVGGPARVVG